MPNGRGRGGGGRKQDGSGQGRRAGAGAKGYCVCPSCGEKVEHQPGTPCNSIKYPKCDTAMTRE